MNEHIELITKYFMAGYNCCQSILMTYGPQYGLEKETAARLGAGMGGGLGHTGHVCGFISGAVLLLGLSEGDFDPNDNERKMETVEKSAAFLDQCREVLGHIECQELIQCKIRTREQLGQALAKGKMNQCGSTFIQEIVRLLDEKYLKKQGKH